MRTASLLFSASLVVAVASATLALAEPTAPPSAPPAHRSALVEALGVNGGEAVKVHAERLDIDLSSGEGLLEGHVTVSKGELTLSCPRVELTLDEAHNVTRARASGGVSAELRGGRADADTADLDVARQVLEMRGGVRVVRGGARLTAESARIDLATSRIALSQVNGTLPGASSAARPATAAAPRP